MNPQPSDTDILDFIERNEANVTHATAEPPYSRWRCYIYERRLPSPHVDERPGRIGFGSTARGAVLAAMSEKGLSDFYPAR